ncbi:MAG: V-type ATP synthase subunit A [Candidatus Odinarchaeota archaeon]|nr:V-type ATP synthase subunit A [Candidatus Odinarchaeota archaeon]
MGEGKIVKISGPLVVAEGMPSPIMYEVCYVGEEGLIGEVNRIEGDRVYIQVYEETTGLRPGEKVVGTGSLLSIELAPGIIGGIYDGIMRPLTILREKGDFIRRGVKASPIRHDKKWNFKPSVKKGQKVVPGDILGEVPETSLVTNRIMVPYGINGTVSWIAPEGEYTVDDTIARVLTKDGEKEIFMLQKWPVRKSRPFFKKISPKEPLITGQRIIDTFFPVAKGGTSAIPGGFGTGKCLTGDTKVLLSNGELVPIRELFNWGLDEGYPIVEGKNRLYRLKDPIGVISFDGEKFLEAKATHVYMGRSEWLVKVKTRGGREFRVTPSHKLLVFSNGRVEERAAATLRRGDLLIAPSLISLENASKKDEMFGRERVKIDKKFGGKYKKEIEGMEFDAFDRRGFEFADVFYKLAGSGFKYGYDGLRVRVFGRSHFPFFLDEVSDVSLERYGGYVFDITVKKFHNFIGGDIPTIFHNTVMLHQLAAWADADVVVYVGCGERGNEMTEVLKKFPEYKDPRSGKPLIDRTVLITNTSNMPVAAREASVYTGITIAEYYRDMGYNVALMADSTSRWAEALREISGRLEEMPGEEGYPAYMPSRIAEFYERSGHVIALGSDRREGSITITGAVSPPGGDFSEPVTQTTLRIIKTFWALDVELARRRFFPSINWFTSYTLYSEILSRWFERHVSPEWNILKKKAMAILERRKEIMEIARLVGVINLSPRQRLLMEVGKMIEEDYIQQNALHPIDAFCPLRKMYRMLRVIIRFYENAQKLLALRIPVEKIIQLPIVHEIARMKYIPYEDGDEMEKRFDEIERRLSEQFGKLKEVHA